MAGWGKSKIACTCCSCCDVEESGCKLCALCGVGCLTGLSSWGSVGWVNGQLNNRVGLTRDLLDMSFPSLWKDCMK